MKKADVLSKMDQTIQQIQKGAFLTVQADGRRNTMTIGWAALGICWRKPVFMIAVRNSRYTYEIIEKAKDFTVTLPGKNMQDEIFYCGTKSGRDVDKFKECELKTAAAQEVASPIIDTPGMHIECKIVYKTAMDPANLDKAFESLYPDKDYHTLYFGEVVACYEKA